MLLESAFHWLFYLKFLFRLVTLKTYVGRIASRIGENVSHTVDIFVSV